MSIELGKDSIDIGIVVRDGAAALRFYRDTLGLEHVADTPATGGGTMHRLMCGSTLVKIVSHDAVPEKSDNPGGPRTSMIRPAIPLIRVALGLASAARRRPLALGRQQLLHLLHRVQGGIQLLGTSRGAASSLDVTGVFPFEGLANGQDGKVGIRFTPGGIRPGAAGHDVCFIHPKGNEASPIGGAGVLIELVQAPDEVVEAFRSLAGD